MTSDPTPIPQLHPPASRENVMLSPTDFAEILQELEVLRSTHRDEVAERLRHARTYGTALGDDDHLAILEDAAVGREKIAQLERLVASATIVHALAGDGVVGLGSFVRVRDQAGRQTEYEIVGWRSAEASQTQVTPASPVGEALLGTQTGDVVRVPLPSGRERTLEVLEIGTEHERLRAA